MTPAMDSSGVLRDHRRGSGAAVASSFSRRHRAEEERLEKEEEGDRREPGDTGKVSLKGTSSAIFRLGSLPKSVQGEQVAAGWPAWLSAVAGEAIQGWVPLKADSFEKLEKVTGRLFKLMLAIFFSFKSSDVIDTEILFCLRLA